MTIYEAMLRDPVWRVDVFDVDEGEVVRTLYVAAKTRGDVERACAFVTSPEVRVKVAAFPVTPVSPEAAATIVSDI